MRYQSTIWMTAAAAMMMVSSALAGEPAGGRSLTERIADELTAGGNSSVNSGSTTARRGSINGLLRLTLTWCSREASTALRVTSDPVPAVVGTAIKGTEG